MLQRQNIVLPLASGVDTKSDPKQVEAGKLLELENGVFTRLKSIEKRNGYVALSNSVGNVPGDTISTGLSLSKFGNELLVADGERLYSYDQSNQNWANKDSYVHAYVTQSSVIKDSYQQTMPDGVTAANGIQLYAWEDSQAANTIRYCVIDGQTQQTLLTSTTLTSTGCKPRVILTDAFFLIYFVNTSNNQLNLCHVPIANPLIAPVLSVLTASLPGTDNSISQDSPNYDVCAFATSSSTKLIGLAFNNDNAGTTIRLCFYGQPWQTYPATSPAQLVIPEISRSMTLFAGNTASAGVQSLSIVYATDNGSLPYTTSIKFKAYDDTLSLIGLATIKTGLAATAARAITATPINATDIQFMVFYSTCDTRPELTMRCLVDDNYIAGTPALVRRGVTPIARAFNYNGRVYVPAVYFYPGAQDATQGDTALQSVLVVLDSDGNIIVKALSGLIGNAQAAIAAYGGTLSAPLLSNSTSINGSSFRFAVMDQVLLQGSIYATQTNVSAITVDLNASLYSVNSEELAQNLHLSGGLVQMYDGQSVVEHGFITYPVVDIVSHGSGGNIQPGVYNYTACYEWVDNQGNLHQSRPADPKEVTILFANDKVSLSINCLNLTAKDGVQIVVYRTEANGSILYRTNSLTPGFGLTDYFLYNNPTGTTLTYVDSMSDEDLRRMPQLYTQPLSTAAVPVVENDPAPPTGLVQLHRNRIWVVDSTNPLNLWYSKFIGPGTPVAFNEGFTKTVDPRGGPIVALATIDDKLLVFKDSHIFFIVGQGPLDNGQNDDLSDAILITTDAGCVDPRSIVSTPLGLMFKSRKGIYLIDRSLAVQYIGAPVEAYNAETITSATLVANTNQVRFTLGSGITLVYDYFVQQWGIFTNQHAVDSLVWRSSTMLLRANGTVLQETAGVYTDDNQPIRLKLVTSWLSFANLEGFQRVRRMMLLGAWRSAHQLRIGMSVDFDDTIVQEAVVSPTAPQTYGSASPYGNNVYGGTFKPYQWRFDLARQKSQAVKFTIEDIPEATGSGEGVGLSSLAFEVGAKQGLNKVPASQIVS
jgi:hypothetical protein